MDYHVKSTREDFEASTRSGYSDGPDYNSMSLEELRALAAQQSQE